MDKKIIEKTLFESQLVKFVHSIKDSISDSNGQWTIKGFIDIFQNVYTISSDTKIISKILEIHLFPQLLEFAKNIGYKIVLTNHQNYYPDISFVKEDDETIKFAVDIKTTYRNSPKSRLCNGFTLGSHGEYFTNRKSGKNIQFPYALYGGHFCLGIIYNRADPADIDGAKIHTVDRLDSITSVVNNFDFFVVEKWKIASDKSGSGNTANIGSINDIDDIINGRGMFSRLGESWFDDYWMNYKKITVPDNNGGTKIISSLKEFVEYKKGDISLIVPKQSAKI